MLRAENRLLNRSVRLVLLRLRLRLTAFLGNAAAAVVQDDERLAERLFQKSVGREMRRNSTEK